MSRESDSIQSIIDKIRILQRPPNPKQRSSNESRKAVPAGIRLFPVNSYIEPPSVGQIESGGELSHDGSIRIVTLGNAQVVAPFDGKVVHVGNFKRFGNLIIIEHLGGFHSILWKLNRIEVSVGQWLLTGEPVGWSGCLNGSKCEEINGKGIVYMQLRKKEIPVDPIRWFKPSLVSGVDKKTNNRPNARG